MLGVLIEPLRDELGRSVTVNMRYGPAAPFAAALMERFGTRPVITWCLAAAMMIRDATTMGLVGPPGNT